MRLSPKGKQLVERALTAKAWTLEKLAEESSLGISTVKTFSAGRKVSRITFVKLCQSLEVDWKSASDQTETPADVPREQPSSSLEPQDDLVRQIREQCRQKILTQHSRMRLLSGEEVGVDQLYVDVWVLKRPPHTYQVSPSKLLETFDLRNDRLGLGDRIRRIEGFEVAAEKPKLVILGKPGAGKTTFLKHLAVDWCKGGFETDLIAVLIEFRRIQGEEWHLLDVIGKELNLNEGEQIRAFKEQIKQLQRSISKTLEDKPQKEKQIKALQQQLNSSPLQALLTQGKLLILMDGLDEAPTSSLRCNMQDQLHELAEEYPKNRFALTCRTQIMTSIPDGFTSVEVADFNPEQVRQFVENWFVANGESKAEATQQWETIKKAVDSSPSLKELTVTPVLLSLICVVLQDEGQIPVDRDWLYKKGIKLLLSRWNEKKRIDGWELGSEAYRQLSVEQKELLLLKIAIRKFENPKNFVLFEQDEIVAQIVQFLQLNNYQEGVAVLEAIEAQHGLLIERADELWSFSHLTFQEYFTIQWLTQLPPEQLSQKIENQQWQEVVEQLVKFQQPADRLIELIKHAIDRSIAHELEFIPFLSWVSQKAESVKAPYKTTAIRAFYFALYLDLELTRNIDLACCLDPVLAHSFVIPLGFDLKLAEDLDLELSDRLDPHLRLDFVLDRILNRALVLNRKTTCTLDQALAINRAFAHYFTHNCTPMSELATQLKQLQSFLPQDPREFWQWWQINRSQWIEQLRQVMIEHRNIGYNWQLTKAQREKLQRYSDANNFLANLINIRGAVSDAVRVEIENTLLLPWNELQRYHPKIYK